MTTRAVVASPRSAPGGNVIDINQALVPGDTGLVTRGTTLTEQVYVRLRQALLSGSFQPGQQLTVRGIADTLGVSLTPAREAVQRVVAESGLEVIAGRSIRVPVLDRDTYREIVKIRLRLEDLAAGEATDRISESDIDRLEQLNHAHLEAIQAGEAQRVLQHNADFHFTIYRASGQPLLVRIIESLWMRIGPMLYELFPEYSVGRRGNDSHMQAVLALRRRDRDALCAAIRADLTQGADYLVGLLKS